MKIKEDTPLVKQYFSVKAQHPEAVLLYRVGDFYETYSDDALLAAKVLGIVLTKRSNGDKEALPMAGFPHHALDVYLPKLVRAGYKVAVCDQLEDPKLAGRKLVKRGVTELVTPGVAFSDQMLQQKEHNYLAGIVREKDVFGAAFLDVSTGTFKVAQGKSQFISTLVSSMSPKEMVVSRGSEKAMREVFGDACYFSTIDEWAFVYESSIERLKKQFKVDSLKGFGIDSCPLSLCAAGALLVYLEQTQHTGLKNICSISRIDEGRFVWMDKFTFRNLEIFAPASGADGVSLVNVVDRCTSPMGARMLRSWLSMPIMDIDELNGRYDVVEYFTGNPGTLDSLREVIGNMGDLERIISRAATGKIAPREVLQLGKGLRLFAPLKEYCSGTGVAALDRLTGEINDTSELLLLISSTISQDAAAAVGKGEVIASGVNEELDRLRAVSFGGKEYLLKMQQEESARTGIPSLKISYNNVFGYYIEVRNMYKDKVPAEWIRKQTLVNAERFVTEELKEYEATILGAEENIYRIESEIYASLVGEIQKNIRSIQTNALVVSVIDVLAGFADLALTNRYCRPQVTDGRELHIKAGRHPVIETLMKPGEEYVPNDIDMDADGRRIMILTGPNMAGKSALLRQTALIVLLAQIGCFVPADEAVLGYCDKIFTRVGATDNISKGESTFMVEMMETSMILHNLSDRSLVLLDEIGRGTSTFDGMSIARAIVEYIHDFGRGSKTLFATHYHELNDLEAEYDGIMNYHVEVREVDNNVIFLRKLKEGGTEHSFGIHVARMAGMPREVIASARRALSVLEQQSAIARGMQGGVVDCGTGDNEAASGGNNYAEENAVQLSLFQLDDPTLSSLRDRLKSADLNNMTPLQAFDLLRDMKKELGI